MAISTIYTTILSELRPVIWHGKAVYKHSTQLKSFISKNLGNEYGHLFAEPYISDDAVNGTATAYWASEYISSKAKPITELSSEEQKVIQAKLSSYLNKIEKLSNKLLQSGDLNKIKWGEIIQVVIEVPSFEHVFVENGKIVLVCWGFSSDKTESNMFQLKKTITETIPVTDKPEIESNQIDNNDSDDEEKDKNDITVNIEKDDDKVDEKDEDKTEKKVENKEEDKVEDKVDEKNNGNGKTNILKKYWWLWTIIVVIAIFIVCILFCVGSKQTHLPKNEGVIPPIDSSKIVVSPEGRKVISNQLNIWLSNDSLSIDDFAKDFKKKYSNKEYKIIYYNKKLKRVRIEFPDKDKKKLTEALEKQFSKYRIIIFEESILNNNSVPSDPGFSDNKKSWAYEMIKAYEAWDINKGNPSIIVAIIDDGFDLTHPELTGRIVKPYNVPLNNSSPNTGIVRMTHGTHVSGTAIGNISNSHGVAGIAPNCRYMPVQVGDPNGNMSTTAIIDAVLYCIANKANVINMSLGMPAPNGFSKMKQSTQKDFIEHTYKEEEKMWNKLFAIADKNNVTIVLAGGNDDVLIGIGPMGRTPYTINVSAINPDIKKANFSNYGDYSTVSAPGVKIYSSIPSNKYDFYDGTSMAAPIVTGAVALLKSENPALTTNEIKKILKITGVKVNEPDKYVGELIQLHKALMYAKGELPNIVDCPNIQKKIDSLQRQIDELKGLCDSTSNKNEELVIPDAPKDFKFAEGKWKSSSDLISIRTNKPIELYFDFYNNGTGKLTLQESNGNLCYAGLDLSVDKKLLSIIQKENAKCVNGKAYDIYKFKCVSTGRSAAKCKAKTKSGSTIVEFTLKRVY